MQRIEFAQPPQFALPLFFPPPPFATNNDALEKPSVCVCLCKTTAVEVAKKRRNISLKASPTLCEIPGSFVLEHRFIRAKEPRESRSLPTSMPLIFHLTLQLSQE